jgi:hypothetical protein
MPLEELLFTVNPEKFTNFSAQDFLKASYSISPRNIDKRNIGISKFSNQPHTKKKLQETDEANPAVHEKRQQPPQKI